MKVRILAIVAFILLGVVSVYNIYSKDQKLINEYNNYLKLARENAEKDIPYVAKNYYVKAISIDDSDYKVYLEYIDQLKKLTGVSVGDALRGFIDRYPDETIGYEMLADVYYESEDYLVLLNMINDFKDKGLKSDKLDKLYSEIRFKFDFRISGLAMARDFHSNVAIIKRDESTYYFSTSGENLFNSKSFEEASEFASGYATVKKDGKWYLIDTSGNKVNIFSKDIDWAGTYSSSGIAVKINDKYGYTDGALNVPDKLEYEFASNIIGGVGAVKKDGKWALINGNKEFISDYIYTDIKLTEYNACISNGVIFACKENGKYVMLNSKGKQIGKLEFDDACMFASSQPAAVKVGDKWGFVKSDGEMYIEPEYLNAKSFNLNIAPAFNGLNWGYIGKTNDKIDFVIEPQFDSCNPFANNGYAVIQQGNDWGYIKLISY